MDRKSFLPGAGEKRLDRFLDTLAAAARHPGEEPVHDLRVAIRRLLAFLDLAESIPGGEQPFPGELPSAMKALMRPLGRLRDAHVKLTRIEALGLSPPSDRCSRLYRLAVMSDADKWEEAVAHALRRARPDAFRKSYRAIRLSPLPPGKIETPALARLHAREAEVVRRADEYLASAGPEPLHKLRLAFKAYRYTAEAMASLLPGMTAKTGSHLHDFQTLLGDIHDLDLLLAESRHFREKVLGMPGTESRLEIAAGKARDESLILLERILHNGRGVAGLFAPR